MGDRYTPVRVPKGWNWIEQNKWGGNCNSKIMQSPLKVKFDPTSTSTEPSFGFVHQFSNGVPFEVTTHGEENIVVFDKKFNPGVLKAMFGKYEIKEKHFRPMGISFRFPAEHMILGNRYDGEIIFDFIEITDKMDPVFFIFNYRN